MYIGKPLYHDILKFYSALLHWRFTIRDHSRGLSFQLLSDNWITKFRALTFKDKETEMLDWLEENLQYGDVFLEVGADVGIYSIYAALRKPKTMVYAFEPDYSNLHQFKQKF